jgi:hypothetical protein
VPGRWHRCAPRLIKTSVYESLMQAPSMSSELVAVSSSIAPQTAWFPLSCLGLLGGLLDEPYRIGRGQGLTAELVYDLQVVLYVLALV